MSFPANFSDIDQSLVSALGEPITLPSGAEVFGIFDFPSADGDLGPVAMDYRSPVVTLTANDAAGLSKGDALTIRGAGYTISEQLPTGDGMVEIQMTESQPDTTSGNWQ